MRSRETTHFSVPSRRATRTVGPMLPPPAGKSRVLEEHYYECILCTRTRTYIRTAHVHTSRPCARFPMHPPCTYCVLTVYLHFASDISRALRRSSDLGGAGEASSEDPAYHVNLGVLDFQGGSIGIVRRSMHSTLEQCKHCYARTRSTHQHIQVHSMH